MTQADVFKAYDIRGVAGTEITDELCRQVGQALGSVLPAGIVAVGFDMRPDSEAFAEELMSGLVAAGREVWNLGLIPTDMIYYAVGAHNLAGGAVVTASHNPGKYNGIKVVGVDIPRVQAAVEAGSNTPSPQPGSILEKDLKADWLAHALAQVNAATWPAYKVAIDASNGMAGSVLPLVKTPLQVQEVNYELDGTFPNHAPNPTIESNLQQLKAAIAQGGLDFGVAFDGDGDRAVLVDGKGRMLSGTVLTALIAADVVQRQPGATVVYGATVGDVVPETIRKLGGKAVRAKVGHSFIEAAMRQQQAAFGGELSGHMYFKDNYYAGSGLIGALVAIDIVARSGKSLAELHDAYAVYADSGEINVPVQDPAALIEKLASHFHDGQQDRLDGLTVRYADWWFNVRPSNTEPLVRLNVEAHSQDVLQVHQQEVQSLIDS